MTDPAYLSPSELRDLTGRPQAALQIRWLRRFAWRFAVDDFGKPRVLRAYRDLRLGAPTPEPANDEPDFAALTRHA